MYAKVQKWGNSLALRIPKSFAQESRLTDNAVVDLSVDKGKIVIDPAPKNKYSLNGLLKGVSRNNIHREIDTGKAVGREIA